MKCIKCGYVNPQPTGAAMEACPACGVIYRKAQAARPRAEPAAGLAAAGGAPSRSAGQGGAAAALAVLLLAALVGVTYWHFFWKVQVPAAQNDFIATVYDQVIQDHLEQYRIVREHGAAMDICVHAQLVSASLLQAKKEDLYARWKAEREGPDCAAAGLRR